MECPVSTQGVSSDEYLNYAEQNRKEWEEKGQERVKMYLKKFHEEYGFSEPSKDRRGIYSQPSIASLLMNKEDEEKDSPEANETENKPPPPAAPKPSLPPPVRRKPESQRSPNQRRPSKDYRQFLAGGSNRVSYTMVSADQYVALPQPWHGDAKHTKY